MNTTLPQMTPSDMSSLDTINSNSARRAGSIIGTGVLFLLFFFEMVDNFFPENSSDRSFLQYYQGVLLLINVYFVIVTLFLHRTCNFLKVLFLFLAMLGIYAFFSPFLMRDLPPIYRGWGCFFTFYYLERKNLLNKTMLFFYLRCLVPVILYHLFTNKAMIAEFYGGVFSQADNIGYKVMGIMFLFSIFGSKAFFWVSLTFGMTVLSMKRGAILGSVFFYFIYSYKIILRGKLSQGKKMLLILVICISITISIFFIPFLVARFEAGDNGREKIYTNLLESIVDASPAERWFGYGFYHCYTYFEELIGVGTYAHNDWLEVLHDEGILGLSIYIMLLISFGVVCFKSKNYIPHFTVILWLIFATWIFRSTFSAIIGKEVFTFITLGIICAEYDKQRIASENITHHSQITP